jgi:hypothetical protein
MRFTSVFDDRQQVDLIRPGNSSATSSRLAAAAFPVAARQLEVSLVESIRGVL